MEFGVRLPVGGPLASREAIESTARLGEELGYDSLWVHDFISWTYEMDRSHVSCGAIDLIDDDTEPVMFETITNLAFLTGITKNIRIGSAVLCTPYRNPVVQAKQIACIDVLSGGRLILGAGVGAIKRIGLDFEVVGVPRSEKYERTHEYLNVMREVWENPHPSFDGEFVKLPPTQINPKPIQRPLPVWVGGKGEKAIEIIGSVANGWIPTWVTVDGYREYIPMVCDSLERHGRADVDFTIAKECYAAIASSGDEARRLSRPTFDTFTKGFTVSTYEGAVASALVGSTDDVVEQLCGYQEVGVQHVEMKFVYLSVEHLHEQMRQFAEEVIPQVNR